MSTITIQAGDFPTGKASFSFNAITFPWRPGDGFSSGKTVALAGQIESIETATEEAVKRVGGTIGWGVVGATLLGPAGMLAGLLLGGRGKDVTFIAVFKDGKRMLATADSKTFTKLQALAF